MTRTKTRWQEITRILQEYDKNKIKKTTRTWQELSRILQELARIWQELARIWQKRQEYDKNLQ